MAKAAGKKAAALFLAGALTFGFAGCGGPEPPASAAPGAEEGASVLSREESAAAQEGGDGPSMAVVYFSYAENAALPEGADASASASIQLYNGETTGNTGVVAAVIAEATGAKLLPIRTEEPYPDTYDATLDQAQEEKNAGARPALASSAEGLDGCEVVFLGFPNWWGDMPMAVYSFLDEADLSGKTVVPFVTSGGSGFSGTVRTIADMEPDADVTEGLSVRSTDAANAQEQVDEWLRGLGYVS